MLDSQPAGTTEMTIRFQQREEEKFSMGDIFLLK
jgi:hypothetical protein